MKIFLNSSHYKTNNTIASVGHLVTGPVLCSQIARNISRENNSRSCIVWPEPVEPHHFAGAGSNVFVAAPALGK
jgi:hypothetical protein